MNFVSLRNSIIKTSGFNRTIVRFQSMHSVPDSINKKSLVKNKRKLSNSSISASNSSTSTNTNESELPRLKSRPKYRYYSLPRVPSTSHLKPRDMSTTALYSGYRPLFINPEEIGNNNSATSTLYEFAMKFEEPNPVWSNSATGLESFDGWENIPVSILKHLKPFVPPNEIELKHEIESQENKNIASNTRLAADPHGFLKKVERILNKRKGGRRRPIVKLLQLKKNTEDV